jgi:hypothetical protein
MVPFNNHNAKTDASINQPRQSTETLATRLQLILATGPIALCFAQQSAVLILFFKLASSMHLLYAFDLCFHHFCFHHVHFVPICTVATALFSPASLMLVLSLPVLLLSSSLLLRRRCLRCCSIIVVGVAVVASIGTVVVGDDVTKRDKLPHFWCRCDMDIHMWAGSWVI